VGEALASVARGASAAYKVRSVNRPCSECICRARNAASPAHAKSDRKIRRAQVTLTCVVDAKAETMRRDQRQSAVVCVWHAADQSASFAAHAFRDR